MPAPDDIVAWLKGQERRLEALEQRSPFANTGMSITGEGQFEIDGSVTVTGDFIAEGKISNDALTNPVRPGSIYSAVQGFSLSTSMTNKLTSTITVPAGFTTAHVTVVARCYALNNTAGLDYLYCEANVAGFNGYALPLPVSGSNGSGINVSPFTQTLTGLTPGGTFAVQVAAKTAFASWAADAGNTIELSGSIGWYR